LDVRKRLKPCQHVISSDSEKSDMIKDSSLLAHLGMTKQVFLGSHTV